MTESGKLSQSPETLAAQALGWVDEADCAVVAPLHLSMTPSGEADNSFPHRGRVMPVPTVPPSTSRKPPLAPASVAATPCRRTAMVAEPACSSLRAAL